MRELKPGDGEIAAGISELRDEHLRGVYELCVETIPEIHVPLPGEAPPYDEWLEKEKHQASVGFVALDDGSVVGYARLYETGLPHRLEHGLTAVRRSHRRRGLATALKNGADPLGRRQRLLGTGQRHGRGQRRYAGRQRAPGLPASAARGRRKRERVVIAVRRAESDADLEAWRRVRIAVVPNERAQTVDELREAPTPTQLYLLAELDGRVAGSGVAGRSDLAGQGFLAPRVLPEARRRGVGTALLRELAEHVQRLGFDRSRDAHRRHRLAGLRGAVRVPRGRS